MWPFKKQSRADLTVEWLPHAIQVAAQKWLDFQVIKFRDDTPLEMRIIALCVPLQEGLKQWKALKDSPDDIFFLIACKGVELSGTHTTREIEEAIGLPLPV